MKKLYTEFFRQNKTVGIVACTISALITFFITMGNNMSNYKKTPMSFSLGDVAYIYIIIMIIFAIAMTVSSFGFLNNRNSSDFYHSIPVKRKSLYGVICLSVLTWIGITAIAGTVFFGLMCAVLKYISIDINVLIKLVLCTIECGIFTASLITFSMSISGNITSYVVAAFVILMVPRALIFMVIAGISSTNIYFPVDNVTYSIMNINIVTAFIYRIMYVEPKNYSMFMPYIGTIAESLIYVILGAISFNKRKSECAGKSCISNVVQGFLRIGITLVVSFAANCMLISGYGDSSAIVFTIMVYTGALVVYFLYELITTRNLRRVAASTKQIPIVMIITVVGFLLTVFYSEKIENYRVDYNKTKSITIQESYNQSFSYVFDRRKNPVCIDDENIIKIVAEAYNEAMDDEDNYYGYNVKVKFNDSSKGHVRYVFITDDGMNAILRYVLDYNTDNITDDLFPAFSKKYNNIFAYDAGDLTQDEMINLYNTFRNEVSTAGNYADVLTYGSDASIATIQVEKIKGDDYDATVAYAPISLYTPNTLNLLNEIIRSRSTIKDIDQYAQKVDNDGNSDMIQILMYDENHKVIDFFFDYDSLKNQGFDEISDIVNAYPSDGKAQDENPVVISSSLYNDIYNEAGDFWTSQREQFMGIYNLSVEDYTQLRLILEDIKRR